MDKNLACCPTDKALDHPVLRKLDELARRVAGIGLAVVLPHKNRGWTQVCSGGDETRPSYCRLFLKNAEGAKHCQMCHILISVAACSQGIREHRCHTGVSVLVAPVPQERGETMAVLSTCVFTSGARESAWREARARGKKLGLNLKELSREFRKLPELTRDQIALSGLILETAAQMVREIGRCSLAEKELNKLPDRLHGRLSSPSTLEREFMAAMQAPARRKSSAARPGPRPAIVEIVKDMVNRRPDLTFSVAEIAHAARLTPNYFSSLFRQHTRQRFSEFLAERRIALAKEYLHDLTLSISEVAFKAGYNDPGYFIRCFKHRIKMTPKKWRNTL